MVSKRGCDDIYIVQSIGGRSGLDRINECERKNTFKLNEVNDSYVI
jgi:hypothetical protein